MEISQAYQSQAYCGHFNFRVQIELAVDKFRSCVTMGARDARHQRNFRKSRLVTSNFNVLCTNWHLPALFNGTDGTGSFKFLPKAKANFFEQNENASIRSEFRLGS